MSNAPRTPTTTNPLAARPTSPFASPLSLATHPPAAPPPPPCNSHASAKAKPAKPDPANGLQMAQMDPHAHGTYTAMTLSAGIMSTTTTHVTNAAGESFDYQTDAAGISAPGITGSAGKWVAYDQPDGKPGTADSYWLGPGVSVSRGFVETGFNPSGANVGLTGGLSASGVKLGAMSTLTRPAPPPDPDDMIGDDFKIKKPAAPRPQWDGTD